MAVADGGGAFYGTLKDRHGTRDLKSLVWTKIFFNIGSQRLEEDMDTSGFGFVLGHDYKLLDELRLGLAYGFSGDSTKGGPRKKETKTHAFSLYGDYDFRKLKDLKNLRLSTVLTYGLVSTEDNKFSGKGSVVYFAPTMGYGFSVKKIKDLDVAVVPEFGLRYSRVHQDEQKTSISSIDAATRNILTLVPAVRVRSLLQGKFELSARLGFAYDVYGGGDDAYSVTLHGGRHYQILDQNDKNSKSSVELGFSCSYRITPQIRAALGYSGRYASDVTNNNLSLEVNFRF
jgi:opacity protein-like surface antigen